MTEHRTIGTKTITMRFLILEDNQTDADLCQRAIKEAFAGIDVDIAPTLNRARELISSGVLYQLALLDMNLPDGNGMELLHEIRNARLEMAVVVFTAAGNEDVAVAALKAGADDYIAKKAEFTNHLPAVLSSALDSFRKLQKQSHDIIDVLFIEHNVVDVDLTRRHLKKYAPYIKTHVVSSAETALSLLPDYSTNNCLEKFRVILMDFRLPGLNAFDFVKILRQERNIQTPIIIVTGQGDEEVAVQALKLGVNEYISKSDNYLFRLPSLIKSTYQQCELSKSRDELKRSENKYRLLAENSVDVIFTLDLDFNYTYLSPAVKTVRGYEPDEAIALNFSDVLTPVSFEKTKKIITALVSDAKLNADKMQDYRSVEVEMYHKNGLTVWTEIKFTPLTNEKNIIVGVLGITRDISERMSIMAELRKLSRAVEQSPDSIIITDTDGKIEFCNPAVISVSGYPKDEIIGKNPRIFSSGQKTREEYKQLWETILAGKIWKGEFQNKKKNGDLYWEATTISPVVDNTGKITHYLAIRKDITSLKVMTEELIEAKDRAEESDRLKSAFLANMSHEIRTPMNSIMGFASLLPEEQSRDLVCNYANIIVKNSEQLVHVIDDIVFYSKLQTRLFSFEPKKFDVHALLNDVKQTFSLPELQDNVFIEIETELETKAPAIINSDSEKMRQVFTNLVSNAFKYTPQGTITIGYEIQGSGFRFFVKDTGIGVPGNEKEKIFDRFYRASNVNKSSIGGTGLGLSIVKELVDLLGGKIWVDDNINKNGKAEGSVFYFTVK